MVLYVGLWWSVQTVCNKIYKVEKYSWRNYTGYPSQEGNSKENKNFHNFFIVIWLSLEVVNVHQSISTALKLLPDLEIQNTFMLCLFQ